MATPIVRGDYEQLSGVAQTFSRQAETCQQTLRSVQQVKNVLQGGDWAGQGATAFYNEMDSTLLPALTRLVNALEFASTVTLAISQIVKQTEGDVARLFQSDPSSTGVIRKSGGETLNVALLSPTFIPLPPYPASEIIPHSQSSNMPESIGTDNGCGLVALSAAIEALRLGKYDNSLSNIANAVPEGNQYGYGIKSGIQPSDFARLAKDIFPQANIKVPDYSKSSPEEALNHIRRELYTGNQVIVDYRSNNWSDASAYNQPNPNSPANFAHFARVVGFTPDGKNIILAQSLYSNGETYTDPTGATKTNDPTIAIPIGDFVSAWQNPERLSHYGTTPTTLGGSPPPTDEVYNWMMIISRDSGDFGLRFVD